MEAQSLRLLRPGTEFNACFAGVATDHQERVIAKVAGIDRTLDLVQQVARKYAFQTAKLAPKLRRSSLNATLEAIWHFVYEHVQYKLDEPGCEQVRRPVRTWADRQIGVDCEDYSVFVSSLLLNLGIPHKLRISAYHADWQHIYVVVPKTGVPLDQALNERRDYYVLDPVKDRYDDEEPPTKTRDYPMSQLSEMSGFGGLGAVAPTIDALALAGFGATEAPRIVSTYLSESGHTIGIDQYGQTYLETPNLSGFGSLFSKIGSAVSKAASAVAKPLVAVSTAVGPGIINMVAPGQGEKLIELRNNLLPASFVPGGKAAAAPVAEPQYAAPAPTYAVAPATTTPAMLQRTAPAETPTPTAPLSLAPAATQPAASGAEVPFYKKPMVIGGIAAGVLVVGSISYLALRKPSRGLSGLPRKKTKKAASGGKGRKKKVILTPLK